MSLTTVRSAAEAVEQAHNKQRRLRNFMENFAAARFLTPIMLIFIFVIMVPFMQSIVFSFTDYDGYDFSRAKFIGWSNYVQCFKDPTLLTGLGFTLLYTVVTTILITVIALPLAVVLNRKFFGRNFVRSLFFFFSVPSMAVLGLVWQYIFSPVGQGWNRSNPLAIQRGAGEVLCYLRGDLGTGWLACHAVSGLFASHPRRPVRAGIGGRCRQAAAVCQYHIAADGARNGRLYLHAADWWPESVRSAVRLDQRWAGIFHLHGYPIDHRHRYPVRTFRSWFRA